VKAIAFLDSKKNIQNNGGGGGAIKHEEQARFREQKQQALPELYKNFKI
jgi:hypothetical protein